MSKKSKTSLIDADPIAFLTSNASEFWGSVFEQKPCVYRATDDRAAFFKGLCNFDALVHVSSTAEEMDDAMQWGVDVNAARYVDGTRETLNGEQDVHSAELQHLYHDLGCTLQVHQPQRWDGSIHRIVAALESQLGCLVGCNSYITPPGTQGLAPHYDDVDVFVCQTHGAKRWAVYGGDVGGPAGPLTTKSSADLSERDLPETPLLDVTLQVGDVLYMPRGTVHQARALEGDVAKKNKGKKNNKGKQQVTQGQGSSHLTLSAYQRWNYATLTSTLLQCMSDNVARGMASTPMVLPMALRKGLPVGFVYSTGLQASLQAPQQHPRAPSTPKPSSKQRAPKRPRADNDDTHDVSNGTPSGTALGTPNKSPMPSKGAAYAAVSLAAGLRALADTIEQSPELLDMAADALAFDFWRHRAPPHVMQLDHQDVGPPPQSVDALVQPITTPHVHLTRLVPCAHPEPGGPPCVRLLSCLRNDVSRHMMGDAWDHHDDEDAHERGDDCQHHPDEQVDIEEEDVEEEDVDNKEEESDDDSEGGDDAPPNLIAVAGPSSGGIQDDSDNDDDDSDDGFDSEDEDDDDDGGDLVFEPKHLQPLLQVLKGGPVRVGDVRIQGVAKELEGDAAMEFVEALWNERVVACVGP